MREGWTVWGTDSAERYPDGDIIERRKEHPEECEPIGTVKYGMCHSGLKLKATAVGQLNGFPFWKCECIGPECKKVKDNECSYLSSRMIEAVTEIRDAIRNLKLALKRHETELKQTYHFSCEDGIRYLYPELQAAFGDLKKIMAKIEAAGNQPLFPIFSERR